MLKTAINSINTTLISFSKLILGTVHISEDNQKNIEVLA